MMQPPPTASSQREAPHDFHPMIHSLPSIETFVAFSAWASQGTQSSSSCLPASPITAPRPPPAKEGSNAGQTVPASLPSAAMDHTASKAGICWVTHCRRGQCCSLLSLTDLHLATSQRSLPSLVSIALGVTSSHLPDEPSEQNFC